MARPKLALAMVAMLLAAVPAAADDGPSVPTTPALLPLPSAVTSLPLALEWTPSTFTQGSVQHRYEVRLEDRTADLTQVVSVPAPASAGSVKASVSLVDRHSYRVRVRAVETICDEDSTTDCSVVTGSFGNEERTQVLLAAQPVPAPAPVVTAPPARAPVVPTPAPALAIVPAPAPVLPLVPGPSTPRPEIRLLPRWVSPVPSHRLSSSVAIRLRWRGNRRATFYNVQVFAGRQKIVSVFPRTASYTLRPGILRRGRHRVIVWSGSGSKRAPVYERAPWVIQVLTVGGALPRRV